MIETAVVVPTHNRPHLLGTTLASVLAQQDVDLGVIVVDDGSTDAGAVQRVVDRLGDRRITVVRHDRAQGVSAARNSGIAAAHSEWLAFCDDDDVWAPEKLSEQLRAARLAPAVWAYTGDVAVDADLRVLHGAPPPAPHVLVAGIERRNAVPAGSSNVIVRRSALDAVGWFDASLLSAGDWDLWIRLARHGMPAAVPRPLVAYREHPSMMRQNRRRVLADLEVITRRYGIRVDRARHYRWAAWDCLAEGRRTEALGYYARAIGQGDIVSLARAAVAVAHPGMATRRRAQPASAWAQQAQGWLDGLRHDAVTT